LTTYLNNRPTYYYFRFQTANGRQIEHELGFPWPVKIPSKLNQPRQSEKVTAIVKMSAIVVVGLL